MTIFENELRRVGLRVVKGKCAFPAGITRVKIDVGCSSGNLIENWLSQDPFLFAIGLEPNPSQVSRARTNLSRKFGKEGGRWIVMEVAIGDCAGQATLYVPHSSDDQSSLLHPKVNGPELVSVEVKTETLKALLDLVISEEIKRVDFLKTDCQGMDLQVLRSGGELLGKVAIITAEADAKGYAGANNQISKMRRFLKSHGFEWLNKRSNLRRALGNLYSTLGFQKLYAFKLPTRSPQAFATSRSNISTDDPTFGNQLFADEIREGKISAFQRG